MSVDVRSVVGRRLAVRLPGHEHEPSPWLAVRDGKLATWAKNGNLRAVRPATVSAEVRLSLQHVDEAVEVRGNRNAD